MTIALSVQTLSCMPDGVQVPNYKQGDLRAGIVHIGVGNFHRAHQAWYLHSLMQKGKAHDWAIIGAGVRQYDEAQRQKLAAQNYLTTLIALDPAGQSAEIVGSMIDYLPVEEGNAGLIARMAQSDIRIVSLTVTEGGYYLDPVSKGFDAEHPDMQYDAAHPAAPRTAFGAIVAALRVRRDKGVGPFTGLCCDNLQGNGAILRQTVVSLARLSDPALADWIDSACCFPNSMVDCIVPATGERERDLVNSLGIADAAPVTHENFRQWVIEDDFCAGRPGWEEVGVTFSKDVHGFETQKIRILNAGHQVIANAAELLGLDTIAETLRHEVIRAFLHEVQMREIVPHIQPVPGMTPAQYVALIERRFANPAILDTVRRVAFDGSSRHPGFVVPTIRDAIASGGAFEGLALVEAAWARMCEGSREDGTQIEANDPYWSELQRCAVLARGEPLQWLEMRQLYGELADHAGFAQSFEKWLKKIYADGIVSALETYLKG